MKENVFYILVGVAILLSIGGLIKPAWPLTTVAVLLIGVALLVGK